MVNLPFNEGIIEWLADNRIPAITVFFQILTILYDQEGYIVFLAGIYWLYRKELGLKLVKILLVVDYIHFSLKLLIQNPRPFIESGDWEDKWEISDSHKEELITEYSTPSGHASLNLSIFGYLHATLKSRKSLFLLVLAIFVGLSRPYIGVHYVEDIILGWLLALVILYAIIKYEDAMTVVWNKYSVNLRLFLILAFSLGSWMIIGYFRDYDPNAQRYATTTGTLFGIFAGEALEKGRLNFSTICGSRVIWISRYLVGVAMAFIALLGLDVIFSLIADDDSLMGMSLRFIRYTSLGVVVAFGAPWLFVKTGLANRAEK